MQQATHAIVAQWAGEDSSLRRTPWGAQSHTNATAQPSARAREQTCHVEARYASSRTSRLVSSTNDSAKRWTKNASTGLDRLHMASAGRLNRP